MLKKRAKRILFLSCILVVILIASSFIFFRYALPDRAMSRRDREKLFRDITESPELPPLFYTVYDKYFDHPMQKTVWGGFWAEQRGKPHYDCPCREIYIHPGMGLKGKFPGAQTIVALEIEKHCSQQKCFDYYMHTCSYPHGLNDMTEASNFYYHKSPDALNETECLGLILLAFYPYYDPISHPGKLEQKVAEQKAAFRE